MLRNKSYKRSTEYSWQGSHGISNTQKYTSKGWGDIQIIERKPPPLVVPLRPVPNIMNTTAKVESVTYPAAMGNTAMGRKPTSEEDDKAQTVK